MKRSIPRFIVLLSVLTIMGFVFSVPAFGGQQADSIDSQAIAESDGTSGQDTNAGTGIKTGHIQDGAITGAKIVDGAVSDAKISGPISASKISSIGLDADTLDGKDSTAFALTLHAHEITDVNGLGSVLAGKSDISHNHDGIYAPVNHSHAGANERIYENVAVVAQSGGDYTDPVSAMNDIYGWCGSPSASDPCLLKIMPGVYNVGSSSIIGKSFIDIEGSGQDVTLIIGNRDNPLLTIQPDSEVRNLTVENGGNTSSPYNSYGISIHGGRLNNVTVKASGGPHATMGIESGNPYYSPVMTNVSVEVDCPTTSNTMCVGIYLLGYNPAAGFPMIYPLLRHVDVVTNGGGTRNNALYIYENMSPTIMDTTLVSNGGSTTDTIYYFSNGTLTLSNVKSRAEGGTFRNCAILNTGNAVFSGSVIMSNVSASAEGGTQNYGYYHAGGILSKMMNVQLYGEDYGLYTSSDGIEAHHSIIEGGVNSIKNDGTVRIANSQVKGTLIGGGVYSCFQDYDTDFSPVTCP